MRGRRGGRASNQNTMGTIAQRRATKKTMRRTTRRNHCSCSTPPSRRGRSDSFLPFSRTRRVWVGSTKKGSKGGENVGEPTRTLCWPVAFARWTKRSDCSALTRASEDVSETPLFERSVENTANQTDERVCTDDRASWSVHLDDLDLVAHRIVDDAEMFDCTTPPRSEGSMLRGARTTRSRSEPRWTTTLRRFARRRGRARTAQDRPPSDQPSIAAAGLSPRRPD